MAVVCCERGDEGKGAAGLDSAAGEEQLVLLLVCSSSLASQCMLTRAFTLLTRRTITHSHRLFTMASSSSSSLRLTLSTNSSPATRAAALINAVYGQFVHDLNVSHADSVRPFPSPPPHLALPPRSRSSTLHRPPARTRHPERQPHRPRRHHHRPPRCRRQVQRRPRRHRRPAGRRKALPRQGRLALVHPRLARRPQLARLGPHRQDLLRRRLVHRRRPRPLCRRPPSHRPSLLPLVPLSRTSTRS